MIRRYFHCLSGPARSQFCATVVDALNGLWHLGLDRDRHEAQHYDSCIADLGERVSEAIERDNYPYAKAQTHGLLLALSSSRAAPVQGHIHDLAQILFLPREQREEYVNHTDIAPPYKISKLLLEYAVKSTRLDQIQGILTKGYCATRCDRLPVGCCSVAGYDMGLLPRAMLEIQAIEARRAGLCPPAVETNCRYHTPGGCVLRLFKSPACIGFLCEELNRFLEQEHVASALAPYIRHLTVLRNCYLDRSRIFGAMDGAIGAGLRLIDADRRSATDWPGPQNRSRSR